MAGIDLSEHAYEVLAESGARELLDDNIDILLGILFDKEPGTIGAIYEAAEEVIKEFYEERPDAFTNVTAYAEAKGPFFIGQLLMLMACYLRDVALTKVERV